MSGSTPQNLAIFLGNGIYLATDIEQQISVTIGERLEVALVNRYELIRFEEIFFKQKILLPENFGEDLGSHGAAFISSAVLSNCSIISSLNLRKIY